MNVDRASLAVTVMAKAPIAGEAKTRLGREIGYTAAATLYRALLQDTLEVVSTLLPTDAVPRHHIVCPDRRHVDLLDGLFFSGWTAFAQKRAGLMGGIVDAFDAGFATAANLVVVTDADSPHALINHWVSCVDLAAGHDVTLGPTSDGGYYLIVAKRSAWPLLPDLLLATTFSSDTICTATCDRARSLGLSSALGPMSYDVDTGPDLARFVRDLQSIPDDRLRHSREACGNFDIR